MNKLVVTLAAAMCCVGSTSVAVATKLQGSNSEVQIGESYASTRTKMLRLGWAIDREWGVSGVHEKLSFSKYPEVLCGEGFQAVCTGRFKKGDSAILLTIDQFRKRLPVTYITND
ncbi:hypothetical protein H3H37_20350 [Duganella sp. LX20W]|uniref:Uncharacterized protein n=1 Tax=Rugamonas brunnea TaxID=2758569 RepID=A0A7W2IDK1_9BURK|nr:hypothetical protein [Rugamonas brunnea]MBA5639418.1 hypothetical protein [Rugamonas brunnea]